MNLVGGLRRNIRGYDFKYTLDTTRKNWIKSVFPHVESLVNIVANIPYADYNYHGDIIYTTRGALVKEQEETYAKSKENITDTETYEILFQDRLIAPTNFLHYNFFGGICFELLNDIYPNVNLYNFVDPTSDIDIKISFIMNDSTKNKLLYDNYALMKGNPRYEDFDVNLFLVINPTVTDLDLVPYLNPYFRHMSDFILDHMLDELNLINLLFVNSVPFDINEYDTINDAVKKEELGYTVIDIVNSNAKLVRYLDSDEKTLRIQIVLKIIVDGESIIDHLLEFLINLDNNNIGQTLSLENYNISSLYTLFSDNLEAYSKRKILLDVVGPRMHKPVNHFTRFIYLLDLIKKNPQIYQFKDATDRNINSTIVKYLSKEYIYYVIKENKFIKKEIPTIAIIYAFYNIFTIILNPIYITKLKIEVITQKEEQQYYDRLMSLFEINASPFRKFSLIVAKGKKNKKTNKRYKKVKKNKKTNKRYKKH